MWLSWLGIISRNKRGLFNSQSGPMPGLRDVWKATRQCFSLASVFLSLFFSLPPIPSKIKKKKKRKIKEERSIRGITL